MGIQASFSIRVGRTLTYDQPFRLRPKDDPLVFLVFVRDVNTVCAADVASVFFFLCLNLEFLFAGSQELIDFFLCRLFRESEDYFL